MPEPRPVRWLHISDLHLGCRGTELWWGVEEDFEKSIREMAIPASLGPPDLLLISGDLTNSGRTPEFKTATRFLEALLEWLREAGGAEPFIIPVPGNHDLIRPEELETLRYLVLDGYDQGADNPHVRMLDETLWKGRDAAFVKPLFKDYLSWLGRRIVPELKRRGVAVHRSHFPGDLCVELEIPGTFPLCIVGLNSAWLQYSDAEFEGKLALPVQQFQAALPVAKGTSPFEVFKRCRRALLMMHHPPEWLSKRARKSFFEEIYLPDRFDLCLHGHMHEGRSESVAISAGPQRHYFQAPSLFGLEHYGSAKESRALGYAWGTLSADGEVRIWPRKRVRRGDGSHAFVHDQSFPEDPDGVVIRPAQAPQPPPVPKRPGAAELRPYLEDLVDRTGHINIGGISAAGKVKGALRPPIERLYTPLHSRGEPVRALADAPHGALCSNLRKRFCSSTVSTRSRMNGSGNGCSRSFAMPAGAGSVGSWSPAVRRRPRPSATWAFTPPPSSPSATRRSAPSSTTGWRRCTRRRARRISAARGSAIASGCWRRSWNVLGCDGWPPTR